MVSLLVPKRYTFMLLTVHLSSRKYHDLLLACLFILYVLLGQPDNHTTRGRTIFGSSSADECLMMMKSTASIRGRSSLVFNVFQCIFIIYHAKENVSSLLNVFPKEKKGRCPNDPSDFNFMKFFVMIQTT